VVDTNTLSDDERRLAELGYKQELNRSWSGFSNFAISFSIISILSGCFTTFGQAWNNGGPIAISIGWPVIATFILIIGLCMAELASAFPTSGGIYWWASRLGGPAAGFFTGWLNLIGLIAITASVVYGCATFLNTLIVTYWVPSWGNSFGANPLVQTFVLFMILMVLVTLFNIFSGHLMAVMNNTSVWWHVFGASAIVLVLVIVPSHHATVSSMVSRLNNSGFASGSTSNFGFWFYVLPLGFLLTQYTITGFDASAHLSEETQVAHQSAAKGMYRSILYSAIGGWILLLAFLYSINDPATITKGGGSAIVVIQSALTSKWAAAVLVVSTVGQFLCSTSCLTSTSRMMFAFSRDGAVPGSRLWSKVNQHRVPINAVMVSAVLAVLVTLPALKGVGGYFPVAFFAVVSIGVIGLYVAFLIPIWLRLRLGDAFQVGSWNLGKNYKWMCWVSVIEIVVVSVYFLMPTVPAGVPGNAAFAWASVNYTPIVVLGALLILTIWWFASAKNWFKGPKRTIDLPPGVSSSDEIAAEHAGTDLHEGHAGPTG
jgi:amino acid transporter